MDVPWYPIGAHDLLEDIKEVVASDARGDLTFLGGERGSEGVRREMLESMIDTFLYLLKSSRGAGCSYADACLAVCVSCRQAMT